MLDLSASRITYFTCRLLACGVYYYGWLFLIPRIRGYRVQQEILRLDNGAVSHRLVKVPLADLERWEAEHDEVGRLITHQNEKSSFNEEGEQVVLGDKEKNAV